MDIVIKINLDNDAFSSSMELPRILEDLAKKAWPATMYADLDGLKLRDINGNSVGKVVVYGA